MEYQSETKNCQNCKKDFIIEPEDFLFYEKIKVPAPTFCPDCRTQRRMTWRNERTLYRRKCDLCGKNVVTIYSGDNNSKIYCQECFRSDKWEPLDYGLSIDFSVSILSKLNQLLYSSPFQSLFNLNIVNSEYCNNSFEAKNCYLCFASDYEEDCAYTYRSFKNKKCYDLFSCQNSEISCELIDCKNCYSSNNLLLSENCINCDYCLDCNNCSNCIGCYGLRNQQYQIFNKQFSPDEYKKEILKFKLNTFSGRSVFSNKFIDLIKKYPRKFSNLVNTESCSGNNIRQANNCKKCFDIKGPAKDIKYSVYLLESSGIYDAYAHGFNVDNNYEIIGGGSGVFNSYFSFNNLSNCLDLNYCMTLSNCQNCFACIGLRNKQYCILNKQYTKEEYEELVPKIIKQMSDMPYIDKMGRVYKYGEFFPSELSPFAYNETIAQEYFPLTKEEAQNQGYRWKDREERNYQIDIKSEDIPDDINDITDDITSRVIECAHKGQCNQQCTEAFKIIPEELSFYKRMNLPIPRLCPNCRHYERLSQRNPLKLWHRNCMKEGCANEFETSYAPDRPEIIYCEKCYQQEVY